MADKRGEAHAFVAMLVIETDDPQLSEAKLAAMDSASRVAAIRHAVLQHLPQDVKRVVALFPVEHARMLMMLHEAVGKEIADELGVEKPLFQRPPADYVPPT
jgi:hypothetical protein